MREAAEEKTFSGELRRAIHGGDRDLISLADSSERHQFSCPSFSPGTAPCVQMCSIGSSHARSKACCVGQWFRLTVA